MRSFRTLLVEKEGEGMECACSLWAFRSVDSTENSRGKYCTKRQEEEARARALCQRDVEEPQVESNAKSAHLLLTTLSLALRVSVSVPVRMYCV